MLGVRLKIMLPHDPEGKNGPKTPLPDTVTIMDPKEDKPPAPVKALCSARRCWQHVASLPVWVLHVCVRSLHVKGAGDCCYEKESSDCLNTMAVIDRGRGRPVFVRM